MICIHNATVVEWSVRAVRGSRAASDQNLFRFQWSLFTVVLNFDCVRVQKQCVPLMDINPITRQLQSNNLSFALDNRIHSRGDVLNRNAAMAARPIAVSCLYCETGELKDGFTYRFAGDGAGMSTHASDHGGPIDDGNALAGLCRRDGALLARWASADHHKVIF